jgi:predicted CXXCH cytochrome family protein
MVALAASVSFTNPQEAGILRPTDQTVLETEEVRIIARDGALWLDGESLERRQTQGTRQALAIRIPPGRHELVWKRGGAVQTTRFAVATSRGAAVSAGWKVYREHPPQAECVNCHAGEKDFKKSTIVETCFTCHEPKSFAEAHSHNSEVLAECVLCHDPHGSAERFLLRMTRETACKQCHG